MKTKTHMYMKKETDGHEKMMIKTKTHMCMKKDTDGHKKQ